MPALADPTGVDWKEWGKVFKILKKSGGKVFTIYTIIGLSCLLYDGNVNSGKGIIPLLHPILNIKVRR